MITDRKLNGVFIAAKNTSRRRTSMCPRADHALLDNETVEEKSEDGTLDMGGDSDESDDDD